MHNGLPKGILAIIKLPLLLIKYYCVGIFLTMYIILSFVVTLLEYMLKGIKIFLFLLQKILFYLVYGIATPLLFVVYIIRKAFAKSPEKIKKQKAQKKQQNSVKLQQREEKSQLKQQKKEQAAIVRHEKRKQRKVQQEQEVLLKKQADERKRIQEEEIKKAQAFITEEKNRKREEDQKVKRKIQKESKEAYINKNVKIDKKKNSFFSKLTRKIGTSSSDAVNKVKNNSYSKYRKNKKELNRQVLLINFEGDDAKKSDEKLIYQYVAKDPAGNVIKGISEAYSQVEVHSYLLSEGYEVYSIKTSKWIRFANKSALGNKTKFKNRDLIFFLTQLSTYLKAGITLVEALRILSRQYKKKEYKRILKAVVYDLTMGDNLSDAMEKQNVAFPKLLINMIKTAEMTGELPEVLDDMVEYYTEIEQTRKQMISALTYPSIVFIFSVAVITFMLVYVIPQFTGIYESMDGVTIPTFTLVVMSISAFLKSYSIILILVLIALSIVFILLYKYILGFRTTVQWVLMHVPVIGNTIIYKEVTNFTKTFASLLSHSVFITDSMDILNKITNNEIYKILIVNTITNLAKGDKISAAFKDHWAFPMPAYEMLVTGESTGELPEMMNKVSGYYQMLHKDSVTRIKTFIEPILTVFLTVVVGAIILAVIIPMFGMYNSIQSY